MTDEVWLSHSEIAAWESCRLRWAVRYFFELSAGGPPAEALRLGSLAHLLAAGWTAGGESEARRRLSEAVDSDATLDAVAGAAWSAAAEWHRVTRVETEWAQSVTWERPVERRLPDGMLVRGQVDVTIVDASGRRRLWDLKVVRVGLATAARRYERSRQLALYDWIDGGSADEVRYDIVSARGEGATMVASDPAPGRSELEAWLIARAAEIAGARRRLAAYGWRWDSPALGAWAHVHDGCRWCEFDAVCVRRRAGGDLSAVTLVDAPRGAHYRNHES